MSLLSVTVKKASYDSSQDAQFNTYCTLKLQNVKSTTVTVKGASPCWEQDFLFETNDVNTGLLIEVWNKGMIWDRALGYYYMPLTEVQYSNEEGSCQQWLVLEAELVMRDSEVVGTKNPTGHSLLVDCRFELPFDPENTEAADLQRKLEMLNSVMDHEARADQTRRQMQYYGHSGYSEDSDYTSDLNYPVGQHPNSSASQFRSAAHQMHTPPQRSLETSRENSYERDDAPGHQHGRAANSTAHDGYPLESGGADPLYYNSRPRGHKEQRRHKDYGWDSEDSNDAWCYDGQLTNHIGDPHSGVYADDGSGYYNSSRANKGAVPGQSRRPSLERQAATLYDDQYSAEEAYKGDPSAGDNRYTGEQTSQWDTSGYYSEGRDQYENTVNSSKHCVGTGDYVDNSPSYAQYDGGGGYEVNSGEYNNFGSTADEQYNSSGLGPGRARRTNSRQSSIDLLQQGDGDIIPSTDHQQQQQKRSLPSVGGVPYSRQQQQQPPSLPKAPLQQQQQQPAPQPQKPKVHPQAPEPQQGYFEGEYDDAGYYDQEQAMLTDQTPASYDQYNPQTPQSQPAAQDYHQNNGGSTSAATGGANLPYGTSAAAATSPAEYNQDYSQYDDQAYQPYSEQEQYYQGQYGEQQQYGEYDAATGEYYDGQYNEDYNYAYESMDTMTPPNHDSSFNQQYNQYGPTTTTKAPTTTSTTTTNSTPSFSLNANAAASATLSTLGNITSLGSSFGSKLLSSVNKPSMPSVHLPTAPSTASAGAALSSLFGKPTPSTTTTTTTTNTTSSSIFSSLTNSIRSPLVQATTTTSAVSSSAGGLTSLTTTAPSMSSSAAQDRRDSLLDGYQTKSSLLDEYNDYSPIKMDDYFSKRDSLLDDYPTTKRDSLLDDYPTTKRDSLLDDYPTTKRDSLLDDYPMDKEYGEGLGDEEYYYDASEYNFDDSYYNKYDEGETYMDDSYGQDDEEYSKNKDLLAELYGQQQQEQDSFESRELDAGLDTYGTDVYGSKAATTTEQDRRPTTSSATPSTTTTTTTASAQQQPPPQQQSQLPFSSIPKPSLPNLGASLTSLKSAAPMFGKFTSAMSSLGAAVSSVIPQPPGAVLNPVAQNTTTRTQRATLRTQESMDSVHQPDENKLSVGPTLKREASILKREPSIYDEHGQLTRESSMDRFDRESLYRDSLDHYDEKLMGQSSLERQDSLLDPLDAERQDSFEERYDSEELENSLDKYEMDKRRGSLDRYDQDTLMREQSLYEADDLMMDEPHDNSLIEPYQPAQAPHSPAEAKDQMAKELDEERLKADKAKSVSFEEEEKKPPQPERKKMTAKERWHWSYNRIIMQLNVSSRLTHYS